MKLIRVDHLGVAVKSLAESVRAFEALGFEVTATHDVPTEKVRTAFLPIGESQLELLEPSDPGSVIAKFLEKRSGLHHICVQVDDIVAALQELKAKGVALIDERFARILRGTAERLGEAVSFGDPVHGRHDQGPQHDPRAAF